jgi:hypothetical protein
MVDRFEPRTLVAVIVDGDPDRIIMIGRVITDNGDTVVVRSDDDLEREAAIEHGFTQPEPRMMEVLHSQLRPILPRLN